MLLTKAPAILKGTLALTGIAVGSEAIADLVATDQEASTTNQEAEQSQETTKPKQWPTIPFYRCYVRGFRFHSGPSLLLQRQAGDQLDLLIEPTNPVDPLAIAIYWDGQKIGYIPREDNAVSQGILSGGVPIYAEIIEVDPEAEQWEQVAICLYLVTSQELLGDRVQEGATEVIWLQSAKTELGSWIFEKVEAAHGPQIQS